MSSSKRIIRNSTSVLLGVGLALAGCETGRQSSNKNIAPSIGKSAMAGVTSAKHGLPENFGGTIASTVSIDVVDRGELLSHASGVKIGLDKVLTAGHVIYDLRGGYGPDPQPGYCVKNPEFNLEVDFSGPGGRGSAVHVGGVALSDRRDLAVLTVDRTSLFDKIPIAPIAITNDDTIPAKGSIITMAGYPTRTGDGLQVQNPLQAGEHADVYVWTGPVDEADNYYAVITLPAGIKGGGTSGGPISSDGQVVGVVHAGEVAPGETGSVSMEHAIGVSALMANEPGRICG